jgi:hypothetical protein
MTKEVLEALCKGVQDDLANKLHVEEVAIKHRIEHIIKTLTELNEMTSLTVYKIDCGTIYL